MLNDIYLLTEKFPLVHENFQVSTAGFLTAKRHIAPASDMKTLLHWITPSVVAALPDDFRDGLVRHILLHSHAIPEREKSLVIKLPIFKQLESIEGHEGPILTHIPGNCMT